MEAIREGVKETYAAQKLPFVEAILQNVDERSLGEYIQWKMIETMLLGRLMDVDAFDQPHVELYKQATKRILGKG